MAKAQSTVTHKDIKDFPGYRVGDDGTVWSCWRTRPGGRFMSQWRPMKLAPSSRGYFRVNLTNGVGKVQMFRVHRLVLEVFIGPCPDGMEARHLNGIKTDNRLENLVWGTPVENRNDNHRLGVYQIGESHPISKLTDSKVREIRLRFAGGELQRDLAAAYGVSVTNISNIVNRKSWRHVG